jgi:hypothetical protein
MRVVELAQLTANRPAAMIASRLDIASAVCGATGPGSKRVLVGDDLCHNRRDE